MKLEKELLDRGLISKETLDRALEIARNSLKALPVVLVEQNMADEEALLRLFGEQYGLELTDLKKSPSDPRAIRSVSAKIASHYGIVPLSLEGSVLTIAVSNPLDMSSSEDIETNLGLHVERVLARRNDIQEAIRKYYGTGADTVERILSSSPERGEIEPSGESNDLEKMAEDASVVKLVNQLIQEAIQNRATDIHFEALRDDVSARRRIDGVLFDMSLPKNIRKLYPAIVSRIKLMSGLNIVERRMPQDGRARVNMGRREYDLRVSIVPAIHGEDIVIRILPTAMLFDLDTLGFSDSNRKTIEKLISNPHGIIFVTGPTGSGKSTTLYACLSKLNTRERKIITIEDPVEYELKGLTQTQVNPKIGLTFARALRSMLRHDPDVMMVGEVRDKETAEIAVQTAMTGHLVLSTLHTNDAASAAVRLMDMGIDPYLIASTVRAFAAQRLVRVICENCRKEVKEGNKKFFRGKGCEKCGKSGYIGRVAICEILTLDPKIQKLILNRASASEIRDMADSLGMMTLIRDGEEKVARGITTPEEIIKVTTMA